MIIQEILEHIKQSDFINHVKELPFNTPEMFQASFSEVVNFIHQVVHYPIKLQELFDVSGTNTFGVYLLSIAIKCSTQECLQFIQKTWSLVYPKATDNYKTMLQNLVSVQMQSHIESKDYSWISKMLKINPELPARNIQVLITSTETEISEYKQTLQEVKETEVLLNTTETVHSEQKGDLNVKLIQLQKEINSKILILSEMLKTLREYSTKNGLHVKYIDEFHQKFCENSVMSKPMDIAKHTLVFRIQTLKTKFEPNLLDSLNYETATRDITVSYISSKYIQMPQPDTGGFEFNLGWVNDISKYLESLSISDFFTMLSFIDNSGVCAVCTEPQMFEFYPYFWQLIELIPDTVGETNAQKYRWLVEHPENVSTGLVEQATEMYTKKVNELILRAPMLDHDIVLWSGDTHGFLQCTGSSEMCTSTELIQCTLNPYAAIHSLSGERVLKRIRVPKRTHAVYVSNLYSSTIDIVLPIGTKFNITGQSIITVQPDVLTTLRSAVCTTGVAVKMTDLQVEL